MSGLTRNVTDVNLVLHDVNGRPYDTELLLESPDGRYAHVLSDIVDEGEHLEKVDLRLDDEAAADIPRVDAPVSGSYRPANYDDGDQSEFFGGVDTMDMDARLSAFDGGLANGTWKLWMLQEYCCEVVTIGGWSLEITTEDPPAAPATPGAVDTTAPVLSDVRIAPRRLPTGARARLHVASTEAAQLDGLVQRKKAGKWKRVGTKHWSVRAGTNTRIFYGKAAQRRLRSGAYRVLLVATDAAGNASVEVRRRFRVDRG